MSLIDELQAQAEQVVSFPRRRVAFRVRAVSSIEIAKHQVAALMVAKGKRTDPAGDRLNAQAEEAKRQMVAAQARLRELAEGREEGATGLEPAEAGERLQLLTQISEAYRTLYQLQVHEATMLRPEGAEKRGELLEALACGGVVAAAQWSANTSEEGATPEPDGLAWEPLTLVRKPQDECGAGELSVSAIPWAVPALAAAVDKLSKGDAGAQLAPFRGVS